ncbi:hypothetical protein [Aedoeadaptatus coxii]|nr:hypothetical protein [Peptoniphilus coxii]
MKRYFKPIVPVLALALILTSCSQTGGEKTNDSQKAVDTTTESTY